MVREKDKLRDIPEGVRVHSWPALVNPCLVAAWPGVANVALGAVAYLRQRLGAEEFAEVDPLPFHDIDSVLIQDNVVQSPRFPKSIFYYLKNGNSDRDLLILESDAQPSIWAYQMATKILDFAQCLGVTRVYTLAAALIQQFNEDPKVWATATDQTILQELQSQNLVMKGNFYVAGMNGLLLSVAKEKRMEGICLLGETPRFPPEIGNPFASLAMLEALARTLQIDLDVSDLKKSANQAREEINNLIAESRHEFIDHFTVPLWDSSEEEND